MNDYTTDYARDLLRSSLIKGTIIKKALDHMDDPQWVLEHYGTDALGILMSEMISNTEILLDLLQPHVIIKYPDVTLE